MVEEGKTTGQTKCSLSMGWALKINKRPQESHTLYNQNPNLVVKTHPIHLSIKNYQNLPKEAKLRLNLPGNGDMSDPDETKPSMGVEEDETNLDSCTQPTSLDGFNGKKENHKPTWHGIYITLIGTEIYRQENSLKPSWNQLRRTNIVSTVDHSIHPMIIFENKYQWLVGLDSLEFPEGTWGIRISSGLVFHNVG